jgi:hypothetical protein
MDTSDINNFENKWVHAYAYEFEKLFNEKNYEKIIRLFESKEEVLNVNEYCVNKYLWSLWLNDGAEEKAYKLSCEYGSKFNTNRWVILKGHYSKWKKWYDNALSFYKGVSEKDYNEVLSIFEDYRKLYEEKKYKEVIDYFQNKLFKSVSRGYLDVAEKYLWALFKNDGTEAVAYTEFKKFNEKFPNESAIILVGGYISKWLGIKNNDIEKLEESIALFKPLNKKDEVEKCIEKIYDIKSKVKGEEKRIKEEERQRIKDLKIAEKAEQKRIKEKEKEKADNQHKFKSSRGFFYCIYCGKTELEMSGWTYDEKTRCSDKENGHNYVPAKDDNKGWKLRCNKCGNSASRSWDSCYK